MWRERKFPKPPLRTVFTESSLDIGADYLYVSESNGYHIVAPDESVLFLSGNEDGEQISSILT